MPSFLQAEMTAGLADGLMPDAPGRGAVNSDRRVGAPQVIIKIVRKIVGRIIRAVRGKRLAARGGVRSGRKLSREYDRAIESDARELARQQRAIDRCTARMMANFLARGCRQRTSQFNRSDRQTGALRKSIRPKSWVKGGNPQITVRMAKHGWVLNAAQASPYRMWFDEILNAAYGNMRYYAAICTAKVQFT